MAMLIEEDDRWNVTLYGYGAGHRPPTDDAGWKAFAATVTDPDVVAALEQAEPLGPIVTHAYPASVRRRYDRLKRFPDRLLVMGDALCSFNPIYGQGMAVATLEAVELRKCLLEGEAGLSRRFMKAAQGPVEHAWKLATGADLALPEIDQVAPLPDRIMGRYMQRLLRVAAHDVVVTRAFLAVTGMVAPPTSLLAPAVLRRVLRGVPRAATRREQAVVLQPAEASA
jgi:2-polyprenyl-6-methoxyphenol hydroxylase-like FAD-dependent oxidoreductase